MFIALSISIIDLNHHPLTGDDHHQYIISTSAKGADYEDGYSTRVWLHRCMAYLLLEIR